MDKPYDLEERTYQFARDTRKFTRKLKRTIENVKDIKQVVRSSVMVANAIRIEINRVCSDLIDFARHRLSNYCCLLLSESDVG